MSDKYKNIELVNNTNAHQFELPVNGHVAFTEYKRTGDIIYLFHTESPKELEGQGVASSLIEKIFEYIEQNHLKAVPYCPFIIAYLKRHPEWSRIVEQ